jgi:hypothetical protein
MVPGATRDYPGVPPGRYRVIVSEPTISGNVSVEEEGDEPVPAIAPEIAGRRSEIPAVYGTKRSPLVFQVPESGGEINVELKSAFGR